MTESYETANRRKMPSPLTVKCPTCRADIGRLCVSAFSVISENQHLIGVEHIGHPASRVFYKEIPHKSRVKLAEKDKKS